MGLRRNGDDADDGRGLLLVWCCIVREWPQACDDEWRTLVLLTGKATSDHSTVTSLDAADRGGLSGLECGCLYYRRRRAGGGGGLRNDLRFLEHWH